MLGQERFLSLPVLADMQHFTTRTQRTQACNFVDRREGNVFELEGNDVHLPGKALQRQGVRVGRIDFHVTDLSCRTIGIRLESMYPIPHPARCNPEHAAKLPAAENPHR